MKSAQFEGMKQHGVAESARWTRAEDYVEALVRRRTFRRSARTRQRSEPESPRLLLSTAPFLVLIGLLGLMAVAIMIAAIPGSQPMPRLAKAAPRQDGIAAKGWLQEARKDFHS